jgi:dTDP-D-glucose 4,6-dehydratase
MYGRPMYFDVSKAKTQLGWKPRYSNDEMFVDSYRWYVANRDTILNRSEGASRHQTALEEGALFLVRWLL